MFVYFYYFCLFISVQKTIDLTGDDEDNYEDAVAVALPPLPPLPPPPPLPTPPPPASQRSGQSSTMVPGPASSQWTIPSTGRISLGQPLPGADWSQTLLPTK